MEVPDIQYTRSGDVAIAYQVVGEGPVDVVWFRGMAGDLLSTWDQPLILRHALGLATSLACWGSISEAPVFLIAFVRHRPSRHGWMTCGP